MSAISDECKLSFYEEITPLKEHRPFWLVRHKQTEKYYVKKILSAAHKDRERQTLPETAPRAVCPCSCKKHEKGFLLSMTLHHISQPTAT